MWPRPPQGQPEAERDEHQHRAEELDREQGLGEVQPRRGEGPGADRVEVEVLDDGVVLAAGRDDVRVDLVGLVPAELVGPRDAERRRLAGDRLGIGPPEVQRVPGAVRVRQGRGFGGDDVRWVPRRWHPGQRGSASEPMTPTPRPHCDEQSPATRPRLPPQHPERQGDPDAGQERKEVSGGRRAGSPRPRPEPASRGAAGASSVRDEDERQEGRPMRPSRTGVDPASGTPVRQGRTRCRPGPCPCCQPGHRQGGRASRCWRGPAEDPGDGHWQQEQRQRAQQGHRPAQPGVRRGGPGRCESATRRGSCRVVVARGPGQTGALHGAVPGAGAGVLDEQHPVSR